MGNIKSLIALTNSDIPPYFELPPNVSTTYKSWGKGNITDVHTGPLGFRSPYHPKEYKDGIHRVFLVGDSITFGIGVNDEDSFPAQLQAQLIAAGKQDIEVWNAGIPGYSMADHLGALRKRLLPLRPDIIVLQLSRNDNASPMPLSEDFLWSLRFSGFARTYMMIRFNFAEDAPLFSESFKTYVNECQTNHISLLVVYEGLPEENAFEVRKIVNDKNLPILEIGGDDYPKLPDDPHFDAIGNKRVAEKIMGPVLTAIRERHGLPPPP